MGSPEIRLSPRRILVGKHISTTLSENRARELWHSFRKREKEISSRVNPWLFSAQEYNSSQGHFTPHIPYEHWASVEISHRSSAPKNMDILIIPEGLYAVFVHIGTVKTFPQTMQEIYSKWIPESGYQLDDRPHLQIMKENYFGPLDPRSEEEVWVPIIQCQ